MQPDRARRSDGSVFFGGEKAVVPAEQRQLTPVHATFLIDHGEVSSIHTAHGAECRGGSAVGHDVADRNLGVGDAGTMFLLQG